MGPPPALVERQRQVPVWDGPRAPRAVHDEAVAWHRFRLRRRQTHADAVLLQILVLDS